MSKSTVLVTGVAGFFGSNLLERLLSEGHSVVGIDNLSMGRLANIEFAAENDRFRFIKDDAMKGSVFQDIAEDIDVAVHLAAFKIPRYGKAIDTLKTNYYCTENVLELARDRNIKCVLASTSDVYGRNPDVPFSEGRTDSVIGSSLSPRWAYAVSKLFDEHLALAYQDAYGFPVTLLRFFGSYGPRQPLSWWGGPPPVFINAVLKDEVGYGAPGERGLCPLDAELNVPPDKYSHGLRRRVAEEAAKSSFDETVASVAKTTGGHVPKRQAEGLVSE